MGKVDTITFDKTGTLTYGKLQVSDIISFDEKMDSNDILRMAASAETKSEHPLGKAIVNETINKKIDVISSSDFKMATGKGIMAVVAEENACISIIALTDLFRPEAEMVIKQLTKMETKTVLLTGDNKRTADYFSSKAGIGEVYAELLPDQKVESIQKL